MGNPYAGVLGQVDTAPRTAAGHLLVDGWCISPAGIDEYRHFHTLWERHAAAIHAAGLAAGRCACGVPVADHDAEFNDYNWDRPTDMWLDGEPEVIWTAWHDGEFCLPARWYPSRGLVWEVAGAAPGDGEGVG